MLTELILLAATILIARAIQVTWRKRNEAKVEDETEVSVEAENEAPLDLRAYHGGYLDGIEKLLRVMGGDPKVYRTEDEDVYLILTSRGTWRVVLRNEGANLIEQIKHRSSQEPPY